MQHLVETVADGCTTDDDCTGLGVRVLAASRDSHDPARLRYPVTEWHQAMLCKKFKLRLR